MTLYHTLTGVYLAVLGSFAALLAVVAGEYDRGISRLELSSAKYEIRQLLVGNSGPASKANANTHKMLNKVERKADWLRNALVFALVASVTGSISLTREGFVGNVLLGASLVWAALSIYAFTYSGAAPEIYASAARVFTELR